MAEIALGGLAEAIGAALLNGDPGKSVSGLAGLDDAGPGDLSFLANPAYRKLLASTRAGAVIVGRDIGIGAAPVPLLQTDNPDLAFAKAAHIISPPPPAPAAGIHPTAVVGEKAVLGENVAVGALSVIEDGAVIGDGTVIYPQVYVGRESVIGRDCVLYPGVRVCHRVTIGSRCIFQSGAVVGSDGFGYAWTGRGFFKIPQVGTVIIEDDVEIGANACIDRARFGETRICAGAKLDNLVQIAHNVKVGNFSAFAAQVGVAGSTTVGAGVRMGGQVGVAGHLRIGDGLSFGAQSGVSKSVPGKESGREGGELVWFGYPAAPQRDVVRDHHNIKKIGKLVEKIRELETRMAHLEDGGNGG